MVCARSCKFLWMCDLGCSAVLCTHYLFSHADSDSWKLCLGAILSVWLVSLFFLLGLFSEGGRGTEYLNREERSWILTSLPEPDVRRVLKALPSARYRALGKDTIWRVLTKSHSAKIQHSAKIGFAECLITDTRQTHLCRVPRIGHSAKTITCDARDRTPLPRTVHLCEDRYRYSLPSARLRHSAKIC